MSSAWLLNQPTKSSGNVIKETTNVLRNVGGNCTSTAWSFGEKWALKGQMWKAFMWQDRNIISTVQPWGQRVKIHQVLAKTATDGAASHRSAQFCYCRTLEWSCPCQEFPLARKNKILYALICSNSLIIRVTPLHSSLTGNTKAAAVHSTESNQQGMQSVWCPHRTQMEALSQSWGCQKKPCKQLLDQPFSLITILPNRGSAQLWGPLF